MSTAPPRIEVRPLPPPQTRFLLLLGLPALALSVAITVVSAYAPPLVAELSSPAVAGLIIGAEGVFALIVPIAVGSRSDRTRSRWGSRLPYLVAGGGLAAVALALIPFAGSLPVIALGLCAFYLGYFAYYAPYRAMYPDCVDPRFTGRALGLQSTLREVGLGVALVGGSLVFALWQPLAFLIASGILVAGTAVFVARVRDPSRGTMPEHDPGPGDALRQGAWRDTIGVMRRRPDVRRLLVANALWEFAQAALKAFIVLFLTVGLGRSAAFGSIVFALVAVVAVAAALIGGRLVDQRGYRRLLVPATVIYGIGALAPALTQSPAVLLVVPLVAFGAALTMSLSYAWLASLMADEPHGLAAGLYGVSQGAGIVLGPAVAGVAVEVLRPAFEGTAGYAAVFVVAAAAVLLSLLFVARVPDPRRTAVPDRAAP